MIGPQPDDLLHIASVTQLCREVPGWLTPEWPEAPWAVARRARCAPGHVAVGIRGSDRSHRHPAVIEVGMISEILSPPDLVERVDRLPDLPVTDAFRLAAPILSLSGLAWGPGGSGRATPGSQRARHRRSVGVDHECSTGAVDLRGRDDSDTRR